MANIYEIAAGITELLELMENSKGDVSEECFTDTFEALEGELEEKVNSWCRAAKNLQSDINAIKDEVKRLNSRKKSKENELEKMKSALMVVLTGLGYEKFKTAQFSLYGFKTDKISITGDVPDEFRKKRISFEPDNEKIRVELEKGTELPFARFINSLTIR